MLWLSMRWWHPLQPFRVGQRFSEGLRCPLHRRRYWVQAIQRVSNQWYVLFGYTSHPYAVDTDIRVLQAQLAPPNFQQPTPEPEEHPAVARVRRLEATLDIQLQEVLIIQETVNYLWERLEYMRVGLEEAIGERRVEP
jgi:hypothetical protein